MECFRKLMIGWILVVSLALGLVACTQEDEGDASEAGTEETSVPEDEVWLDVAIECPSCDGSGDLLFYASAGAAEGMPSFIVRYENPSFPIEDVVKHGYVVQDETQTVAIPEGLYSFNAYQDLNGAGMAPDVGEPAAKEPQVIELKKGELNAISLVLE